MKRKKEEKKQNEGKTTKGIRYNNFQHEGE